MIAAALLYWALQSSEPANLTIRAYDESGHIVCPNQVQVVLAGSVRDAVVDPKACQAIVTDVARSALKSQSPEIRITAVGYAETGTKTEWDRQSGIIRIPMRAVHSMVWGRLIDIDGRPITNATLSVDGVERGSTNEAGEFRFETPFAEGKTFQLVAKEGGSVVFEDFETAPLAATLRASRRR